MQMFRWPGYEMQLLGELQKQQNSAQFCDTLLQTEGISVPTHSCVLAALSPYLSQKLSALSSPPCGQKRQLQLQAVTAQTLLKLVGLLYSGELEVKGGEEQNDVMAAAHRFGITGLVIGHKDGGRKKGALLDTSFRENGIQKGDGRERCEKIKMQDAQVQVELNEKRDSDPLETKKSVSKGTQTIKTGEMPAGSSGFLPDQIALPDPGSEKSSAGLQPQSIALDHQFYLTPCPTIPSDGESTGQLSSSATNPTSSSASSSDTASLPALVSKDLGSPKSQEENTSQQSPRSGDGTSMTTNKSQEHQDGRVESGGQSEQLRRASRDEMLAGEKGNSEERRLSHAKAGTKNMANMLQMETTETSQVSIKMKLKRRTKGEKWEIVSLQDADEAFSVTSLNQGCSNREAPQTHLKDLQTPLDIQNSQPVNMTPPKTPNQSSSSFDPSSSGSITLNQSHELESSSLPQLQEADEQVERWLEDMMVGLNILSNLDSDCEKSQLDHDREPTFSQPPVTERGTGQNSPHAGVGAEGCLLYQDLGTQSSRPSADTGIQYCLGTRSPTTRTSLASVPPDVLTQQRSQFFPSVRSSGRSTGMSCYSLPLSRSENSLCPETASAGSIWSFPSSFSGQKLHYSASQQPSSLKDHTILEFVPFSGENETQSELTLHTPLPCMDDFRLPRRLSPLEPYTGVAQDQLLSNSSANHENDIQKQPSLLKRSWLTETPVSLQFPLRVMIESRTAAPPQDASIRCRTCAECFTMNSLKEKERELTTELTSDPKKLKESCKQLDATEDAAAPKKRRRRAYFPQDGNGFTLPSKRSRVSDGRKTHCIVSLSSRNVLVKEREMAANTSNKFSTSSEKTEEASTVAGAESEESKCPENPSSERTRIRTRGFVKRSQEKTGSATHEVSHVLLPRVRRAVAVNKQGGFLRKRGRPRKIKLEKFSDDDPTSALNRSNNEANGVDKDLPKVEKDKAAKMEGRKRKRRNTRAEGVPLKTIKADCSDKAEGDDNNDANSGGTSRQSWMVTLKEFQKLIHRQHSKTRKSKESQEASDPARDVEREENAKGSDGAAMEAETQDQELFDVTVDENYNQVFNTTAAHGSKTHPDDWHSSASEQTGALGYEEHPEEPELSTEKLLEDPDEGAICDFRRSDMIQPASRDEDACLNISHLLQENMTAALDPNSSPSIREKSDPPVPGADGIKSVSECSQGEEEEEEVDVLVFSPEKRLPIKEHEDGPNMVLTPDEEEEEEEEEVNEIDVTGDETE